MAPVRGHAFVAARATLAGLERMPMITHRQMVVKAGADGLTPTEPCDALAASSPHRSGPRLLHDVVSNSCDAPWSSVSCAEAHGHRPRPVILSRRGWLGCADESRHVPAVSRVRLGARSSQAVLARWSWKPFMMKNVHEVSCGSPPQDVWH
jgi:hypothetical protein